MIDKGMGPRGMNSFNHYAYGCVCEWIWETVAGIAADLATPGFKHIIMNSRQPAGTSDCRIPFRRRTHQECLEIRRRYLDLGIHHS